MKSLHKSPKSKLRVATICGQDLKIGLDSECEIIELHQENYGPILRHAKIKAVICEIGTANSGSAIFNNQSNLTFESINAAIEIGNELNIPFAAWVTVEDVMIEEHIHIMRIFDAIFCINEKQLQILKMHGLNGRVLGACFNPELFNPYQPIAKGEIADNKFVLESGRIFECAELKKEIGRIFLNNGFSESNFKRKSEELDAFEEEIIKENNLPFSFESDRSMHLKGAQIYVSESISGKPQFDHQWRRLEAIACGLLVIHLGVLEEHDPAKGLAIELSGIEDLNSAVKNVIENRSLRERVIHLAWRSVNMNHTFACRINKICETVGINYDACSMPQVSIITPTIRLNNIAGVITTYKKFKYNNKELVIVYNGNEDLEKCKLLVANELNEKIKIVSVPGDHFAAAALNLGHLYATGEYCFRVDDDDLYAEYYILDLVLQARALKADLFGKPPAAIREVGAEAVYVKRSDMKQKVLSIEDIKSGKRWLGGNTISYTHDFALAEPYDDRSYGSADTAMQMSIQNEYTCICCDGFNVIAQRDVNVSGHTWRENFLALTKDRDLYESEIDLCF